MELLLQDFTVTGVALAAAFVLIRRVRNTMLPKRGAAPCATCPSCSENPRSTVNSAARK
jgi:hypothetical protein